MPESTPPTSSRASFRCSPRTAMPPPGAFAARSHRRRALLPPLWSPTASGAPGGWGRRDQHGRELSATHIALADELASAADLVRDKDSGVPGAIVSGLGHLVISD